MPRSLGSPSRAGSRPEILGPRVRGVGVLGWGWCPGPPGPAWIVRKRTGPRRTMFPGDRGPPNTRTAEAGAPEAGLKMERRRPRANYPRGDPYGPRALRLPGWPLGSLSPGIPRSCPPGPGPGPWRPGVGLAPGSSGAGLDCTERGRASEDDVPWGPGPPKHQERRGWSPPSPASKWSAKGFVETAQGGTLTDLGNLPGR